MVKLNIRDKNFGGEPSSCHKGVNKHVQWEFDNVIVSNSVFITDMCLGDVVKAKAAKRKIAWILEPRAIHPHVYEWIKKNNRLFDFVLTFDLDLVERGENFLYYPHGRCWINGSPENATKEQNQYVGGNTIEFPPVYKKTKQCSIIASSKNYTRGHKFRHEIIARHDLSPVDFDVYGYGYQPVNDKRESLDDYRFSITIENSIQRGYWTEKIVDCFATQTIPIFWGDKSVLDHFNPKGILMFDDMEDLCEILIEVKEHGEEMYKERRAAIEDNYWRVEQYRIPEDWIFKNYPFLCN